MSWTRRPPGGWSSQTWSSKRLSGTASDARNPERERPRTRCTADNVWSTIVTQHLNARTNPAADGVAIWATRTEWTWMIPASLALNVLDDTVLERQPAITAGAGTCRVPHIVVSGPTTRKHGNPEVQTPLHPQLERIPDTSRHRTATQCKTESR